MILDIYAGITSIKERLLLSPYAYSLSHWPPSVPLPFGAYLVESVHLLAGSTDITRYLPGVFVGAGGATLKNEGLLSSPREKRPVGAQAKNGTTLQQEWLLIVVVPHFRTIAEGDESGEEIAGPISAAVIDGLQGLKVAENGTSLCLREVRQPIFSEGWAEYPLVFTSETILY